ncbi:MAG: acyl-CoA dehydrogenase family protein [Candidatus Magnetomorum sp.]|nr:acyl-CoA dehydrogenase family protein [Candidatus Magnetomorum sp.]
MKHLSTQNHTDHGANEYTFDNYLSWRDQVNYYTDDNFLQKVIQQYTGNLFQTVDQAAREISEKVSFRWRDMANSIAYPENRPYMMHYDAHNHRIDRIVRPRETVDMEKDIFSEAVFSKNTHPWVKFVKLLLIYENGEACIACPLTCTEGLIALLDEFADTPELKRIQLHLKEGVDGNFGIGAQFISEIQGGSDIPSNVVEARFENGSWQLFGNKFFCSATHADYTVVTARPIHSEKIGLFVVPSWLPGNKAREIRNNYVIHRLKYKMGTVELPTAEITYNGAVAYPVGPLDRGVANVVGIVLTCSRLTVGLSGAASMIRVLREIKAYSEFREAFGMKLSQFPMVASQIQKIEKYAQRTLCGAFKVYQTYLDSGFPLVGGLQTKGDMTSRQKQFLLRELILFQKITTAQDAPDIIRLGMSILGGHGVMEDFSVLPRLSRDAAVNELWEGPRNVLLTQIHRDLHRVSDWYPADVWVADMLEGASPQTIAMFQKEMRHFMELPHLFDMTSKTIELCEQWDPFCQRLFHEYQTIAQLFTNDFETIS